MLILVFLHQSDEPGSSRAIWRATRCHFQGPIDVGWTFGEQPFDLHQRPASRARPEVMHATSGDGRTACQIERIVMTATMTKAAAEKLLRHIHLELARDPDHPVGSSRHRYELIAPLDAGGHIAADAWHHVRDRCRVKRVWGDDPVEIGHLVHKPGGSWSFHYDIHGDPTHDETGYRFAAHKFLPGEYVSLKEQDGVMRTFLVKAVVDLD
jgi:hypothetical protein